MIWIIYINTAIIRKPKTTPTSQTTAVKLSSTYKVPEAFLDFKDLGCEVKYPKRIKGNLEANLYSAIKNMYFSLHMLHITNYIILISRISE